MRINAINNQQTFKGLFIDHSKENGGNWKMEYRPYSWELKEGVPVMQNKEHVNYEKAQLPANEEIYVNTHGRESSKDILGTESYYKFPPDVNNGEMRSRIDVGFPMNREESLNVYLKKMEKFNKDKRQILSHDLKYKVDFFSVDNAYNDFNSSLSKYNNDRGFFGGIKSEHSDNMAENAKYMYERAKILYENASKYVNINESIQDTESAIEKIKEELSLIEKAKIENNYIDISNRAINDVDRPLETYLDEIVSSNRPVGQFNKYISLPKRSYWLRDILSCLHEYAGSWMKVDFNVALPPEAKEKVMGLVRYLVWK